MPFQLAVGSQTSTLMSESVLGVTSPEDLKMAVPYFGDHSKFVEVSTHEMVHQFQIQKMQDAAGPDAMNRVAHDLAVVD